MILPTKHLREDRTLLAIGADVLRLLGESKTVSRLWDDFQRRRDDDDANSTVTYDWFVLALDLLFALGLVDFQRGRILRTRPA
ncbi:MAG: ABC-three component system middle component 6 [Nannocystaceae bacterium]